MPTTTSTPAGGRQRRWIGAVAAAAVAAILAGCGSSGSTAGSAPPAPSTQPAVAGSSSPVAGASSQAPVPAESNPPGDIPDTTVYVPFASAGGHVTLKVPEGWSRKQTPNSVTFTSNLNSISIGWQPMKAAPTVNAARSTTVPALRHATLAFSLKAVRAVTLQGGPAVEIVYQVNSTPNAVTGRQYRLVIERFEFFKNGRAAMLSLSSAVGSDNVDPWRIVSESFRWA
jgi:hypothetical protein